METTIYSESGKILNGIALDCMPSDEKIQTFKGDTLICIYDKMVEINLEN